MAEKANKTNKNNNGILIAICGIAIAAIIIVIAVILATRGGAGLNDSYFVSDGSKYVLNLSVEATEGETGTPTSAHLVYYYSGDNITDMKGFYEFKTEEDAKTAYNLYNDNNDGSYKSVEQSGKYVILTANATDYEGLSASDVKSQIESIEKYQNGGGDTETETTETVEVTE